MTADGKKPLPIVMVLKRQTNTNYPAYQAFAGAGADPICWVEQAGGRQNGWCVHLYGTTPGDDASKTMWFGRFDQAKVYARELCIEVLKVKP
jgi:hypothetical protein